MATFIWIVIKLPQAWWIHVGQNDFTDFIKVTVFGVDGTDSWSTAIGNRPAVTIALIVAIAAAGVAVVWGLRKAPKPDWSFRVDVDKPLPVLDIADRPQPALWLAPPFVEKLLLVGLIAAIYSSVLDIDAPMIRIIIGTSLIIVASAAVSERLSRRGTAWSSFGLQWTVLAVVNSVLIGAYSALLGSDINRSLVFFFGLLLTMIIVLYDRFLGERAAGTAIAIATNPAFS